VCVCFVRSRESRESLACMGKKTKKIKKKRFSSPHSTDFLEEDDDDLDPFANWNNDVDDDDGLARDNCDVSPNR